MVCLWKYQEVQIDRNCGLKFIVFFGVHIFGVLASSKFSKSNLWKKKEKNKSEATIWVISVLSGIFKKLLFKARFNVIRFDKRLD